MAEKQAPPVFTRRCFTGTATVMVDVWAKQVEERTAYSISIKRSWKGDKGYESSPNLRPEDCLVVAAFLNECFLFLAEQNGKK
jgi:hypothetical protein